jgi:D-alanyl-D-alanine carboxypeptidase
LAISLKFGDFNFRNVSGLDIVLSTTTNERLAGGETDVISLLLFIKEYYLKYPEIFDQTILKENNTNIITDELNFLTVSKTGFTSLSGGNLFVGVQKGLNREIFIMVLNSTEKNRFVDVQNIANFLLQSSI